MEAGMLAAETIQQELTTEKQTLTNFDRALH